MSGSNGDETLVKAPGAYPRRSFVYRKLEAHGAAFATTGDAAVATYFGDPDGEAEAARRLALVDLSPLPRGGFKGAGTADWLSQQGVDVPAESNRAKRQSDGRLAARLAPGEVLLLGPLDGDGAWLDDLRAAWQSSGEPPASPRGYEVPRQDSHAWLFISGEHVPAMFAKLCAVDLRLHKFAELQVAQTSVARLSAIIIREDRDEVPGFHLLADSASAEYLWDCLIDAMAEFAGRVAGLPNLRALQRS